MTRVRVYGPALGNWSFSRVARGMAKGLESCGVFAGYVPTDSYDEEQVYPGHDADYGIYVGPPASVSILKSKGWHEHNLYLLPPNSSWMSRSLIKSVTEYVTGFVAPTQWAKSVLEKYTDLPVHLWHHGIDCDVFTKNIESYDLMCNAYEAGDFLAVHFSSTSMERKGTRELIECWGKAVSAGLLGANPRLHLVVDGNASMFEPFVRRSCSTPEARNSIVWCGRLGLGAVESAALYRRHHLVCQPSRGEGFGLVPLEARACGTPVLMTACTGHQDQVTGPWGDTDGVVLVSTGNDAPIDDGPGALAPSLSLESLEHSLIDAYKDWSFYSNLAQFRVSSIHKEWSWEEVTDRWLDSLPGRTIQ